MQAKGPFTRELWQAVETIFSEIIDHPFVFGLANGKLPKNSFAHYLSQDVLYIKDDNQALMNVSERAPEKQQKQFFKTLAEDGLAIEKALHDEFLKHFEVQEAQVKSPVINDYTSFLLKHSTQSEYAIAVAALLPCFWVYNKVGLEVVKMAKDPNPFQKWIDTYQGVEYDNFTSQFIKITEDLAQNASKATQEEMMVAFIESTRFELAFFEEAINQTTL